MVAVPSSFFSGNDVNRWMELAVTPAAFGCGWAAQNRALLAGSDVGGGVVLGDGGDVLDLQQSLA